VPLKNAYYFGTFNPVHCGHLQIAETALEQLPIDAVVFVPAGRSPFKHHLDHMAEPHHRLAMLNMAISYQPRFSVNPLEMDRPGLSYTLDSVLQIRQELGLAPPEKIIFIIGSDALAGLSQWHEPTQLVALCQFAVAPRIGTKGPTSLVINEALPIQLDRVPLVMPEVNISSSAIREAFSTQTLLSGLVPDAVAHYIEQHQLYR